jgi:hypothetical protein
VHPWDEFHLIMVDNLFDMLLDLVCWHFVEEFLLIYSSGTPTSSFFFSLCYFSFGVRVMLALQDVFSEFP